MMHLSGILYNFQVDTQNQETFLVKWNWDANINKDIYYRITHSFQQSNKTKTLYSSYVAGTNSSTYILYNVEPQRIYKICLIVFIKHSQISQINKTVTLPFINRSSTITPHPICLNSIIKPNHIQAIVSCLVGVVVALLLIALIIVLCRIHQHWMKAKIIKTELKGSNKDYYERHRNSETTPIDDYSGYDDCETSCTSQMIADGLAWSPNSSLNSQLNLNILRSKSSLYNHSSSHPSSTTPRIMEEDPFFEAFGDKITESNDSDSHAQLNLSQNPESSAMQSIISPFFGTASTSTINSVSYDASLINNQCQTDSSVINNHSAFEDEKNVSNIYLNESSNSDLVLQLLDEV